MFLPVSHDPSVTDPAQAETATIDVELNREQATSGNDAYWRVSRVRFLGRQFAGPKQAHTVQAYGMNLDGSAAPEQVAAVLLRSLAEMGQAALDGNKDLRASALYRVLALIDPLQVEARSRSGLATADAVAGKTLSGIVNGWADQMQRIVGVGEVKPEQIQPAAGADGKTTVATYADSSGGKATIQLMQAPAGGVTYWRVVDVKLLSGAPAQPSMSATSTRAGG